MTPNTPASALPPTEVSAEPEPSHKAKSSPSADEDLLYAVWRAAHPRAPLTPTPTNRRALKAILAETGADGGLYLTWVAQSDDQAAARLRGDAPWPGGEVVARDDLVSLSRHIPSRLPLALAWSKRGQAKAEAAFQRPARTPDTGRVVIDIDPAGNTDHKPRPRFNAWAAAQEHGL